MRSNFALYFECFVGGVCEIVPNLCFRVAVKVVSSVGHTVAFNWSVSLGEGLDDDTWHSLNITHHHQRLSITLDRMQKTVESAELINIQLNKTLYVGGWEKSKTSDKMKANFSGSIRALCIGKSCVQVNVNVPCQ